ncbi:hypothetical protein [Arthrobacter sp. Rue61a]|uniref:hypothetical protein n=1 Tax=Arthrobacter sp. Rue61a TaxID=1118963 RepID=UPI0002EE12C5|nr:hypothetical protein [Arthrobacter sp. Rue61a]
MPETVERPVAVRATAFNKPSRWLRRPTRFVRYDACWADGRVDFDVSLTQVMYRGHPADFAAVEQSVNAQCPEVGTGEWVDEFGRVVDGPDQSGSRPPGARRRPSTGGQRRKYGVSGYESYTKWRSAWRFGGGVLGVGVGVVLILGPVGAWWAGPVGVVCFVCGLAGLASLVMGKNRP